MKQSFSFRLMWITSVFLIYSFRFLFLNIINLKMCQVGYFLFSKIKQNKIKSIYGSIKDMTIQCYRFRGKSARCFLSHTWTILVLVQNVVSIHITGRECKSIRRNFKMKRVSTLKFLHLQTLARNKYNDDRRHIQLKKLKGKKKSCLFENKLQMDLSNFTRASIPFKHCRRRVNLIQE